MSGGVKKLTEEELLAQMSSGSDGAAANAERAPERSPWSTGFQNFLSTASAGGSDYLDLLARRHIKGEAVPGGVDEIRAGYKKDAEDSPWAAKGGQIGGAVAQALPVGRIMQGAGMLSKAPGIVGGLLSGGALGTGVGVVNEGARQLDRLGSEESAAKEWKPQESIFNVAKEGAMGAVGGGAAGAVGNLWGRGAGMVANLSPKPLPERVIQGAVSAADDAAKLGYSGPTGLAAHEALRAIKDPAIAREAADTAAAVAGRANRASVRYSSGKLPREEFLEGARAGVRTGAGQASDDAASAATKAAKAADEAAAARDAFKIPRDQTLTSGAHRTVTGDPATRALRDRVLAEERQLFQEQLRRQGFQGPSVGRAATAQVPARSTGTLADILEQAKNDPAILATAQKALKQQFPVYGAADDAAAAATRATTQAGERQATVAGLDALKPALGRQNALKMPEGLPEAGPLAGFSPKRMMIEAGKAVKGFVDDHAIGEAAKRSFDDPLEQYLRRIGHRMPVQQHGELPAYLLTTGLLGEQFR
jgi:hypothetical protein